MRFIRQVQPKDLDSIVELASEATFGLTTLNPDRESLADRIEASESGKAPLLVMVDRDCNRIIGTSGLFTHVGDSTKADPFYAYRLERSVHRSETLNVHNEVDALHLAKIFDGPTEVGTLFLHPDFRGGGSGRVLSLSRFMLVAKNPEHYDRQFIAEMRGVIDEMGHSPFWDAIGRQFFQVDFPIADILSSKDKRFIAELMPTHPIYVPLLSQPAQDVIGKVHTKTEPALQLLESEGFHFANMIDIFDGGPVVQCDRKAIRTILESTSSVVKEIVQTDSDAPFDSLVAPEQGPFRCAGCTTQRSSEGITINHDVAEALDLSVGASVLVTPLRGTAKEFWSAETPAS